VAESKIKNKRIVINKMKKINWFKLILSFALVFGAAGLGSYFTTPAIGSWYGELVKPGFNPPSWIFGPVWILLYLMMTTALFIVWQKREKIITYPVIIFTVHLALNALWSILFFGWHNPALALIDIIMLWLIILYLIVYFWRLEKWAGILLIPYILWVSFATILNYSIWVLN